jgi:hypothetical protein
MKSRRSIYLAGSTALMLSLAASLFGHHAVTGFYDPQKTVFLTGVVTRFDWSNPHAFIYIDVKDESGTVSNWALEGNGPGRLSRTGWKKDTLKAGDVITAEAWLPRAKADVAGTLKATPQAADRLKSAKIAHAREVTVNGTKLSFGR